MASKRQHLPAGMNAGVPYVSPEARQPAFRCERREVTVAFADIRGFTTLADCLPPEELLTVVNTYLSVVIKVFLKYEVTINKLSGDSVMGVWNAPADCKQHPLLATMAAMESQRAIVELQRKELTLPKIGFGIGINTGEVVAGNVGCPGSLEYTVIGNAVNVAARLTGITPGGKVWITADTFELVKDRASARALGPLEVKGKRQPVKTYEVLGIDAR